MLQETHSQPPELVSTTFLLQPDPLAQAGYLSPPPISTRAPEQSKAKHVPQPILLHMHNRSAGREVVLCLGIGSEFFGLDSSEGLQLLAPEGSGGGRPCRCPSRNAGLVDKAGCVALGVPPIPDQLPPYKEGRRGAYQALRERPSSPASLPTTMRLLPPALRLRPPKSDTRTPLKATTSLSSTEIGKDEAEEPQSVRRTEWRVGSESVISLFGIYCGFRKGVRNGEGRRTTRPSFFDVTLDSSST